MIWRLYSTYRFLADVVIEPVLAVVPHEVAHSHAALNAVTDIACGLCSLVQSMLNLSVCQGVHMRSGEVW